MPGKTSLLSKGCKLILYRSLFQPLREDLEKDKALQCRLHKIISCTEMAVMDDDDKKTDLEKNECYIADFYTDGGILRCSVYPSSSYSEDGFRYFIIKRDSPFQEIQRRGHQRYPYHAVFSYSLLQDAQVRDIMDKGWKEAGRNISSVQGFKQKQLSCISGGGLRFISDKPLEKGSYLFCILDFSGFSSKRAFPVLCRVVYTEKSAGKKGGYDIRLKYIGIAEEQREKIIRFVFWLERQRN